MNLPKLKEVDNRSNIENSTKNLEEKLKERITSELVIVLTGPLGSGLTTISRLLLDKLRDYNYNPHEVKVSNIIKNVKISINIDETSPSKRIKSLQDKGNKIREEYGVSALANLCILEIVNIRNKNILENKQPEEAKQNLRIAYVIDSIKNPKEISLLRQVYGDSLFVIAVDCPFMDAVKRIKNEKNIDPKEFEELADRDRNEEGVEFGQHTLDAISDADFYIRNDSNADIKKITKNLERFLNLIVGNHIITPTIHETSMYMAYAVSAKSACLSRQVGAVIIDEYNQVISTGCNDVPKFGGGVYNAESEISDKRCYNKGGKCYNDAHKEIIYKEVFDALLEKNKKIEQSDYSEIRKILSSTKIKQLIEFSRAVHAEMNSIINVSMSKNASTKNGKMYCTTFPCHSCARHIVASGITEVFYIEPYAKSLATVLHDDAITTSSTEEGKVKFLPYEGVAPIRYLDFFEMRNNRKDKLGKLITKNKYKLNHKNPLKLDDFYSFENKIIAESKNLINHYIVK